MHDPLTVAFEIKYPWRQKPSKFWPKGYRSSFITIWHRDPEDRARQKGLRADDSCGWFTPPTTQEERDAIRKIGEGEWSDIFGRRAATAAKKDYAYICLEPSYHEAVYWAWRRIKREGTRKVWKFGGRLTRSEEDAVYSLASNPVDNLRSTIDGVKDAEACGDFFLLVYRAYLRHRRPWWRHPRWHVWHWRLQIHPLQKLRRRLFDRCVHCGRPFGWNESPTGNWDGDKLWHSGCDQSVVSKIPNSLTGAFVAAEVIQRQGETLQ